MLYSIRVKTIIDKCFQKNVNTLSKTMKRYIRDDLKNFSYESDDSDKEHFDA